MPTHIHRLWQTPKVARRFRTGVSLHGHTMHSHESLEFLPRLARTIPVVRDLVMAQERRCERVHGRTPDYASAYWTPPLSEREAVRLEKDQISEDLGLAPLVSLTDHDCISAATHLHLFEEFAAAPISVEWTVPFGPSYFHIGVHNLPRDCSAAWMNRLAQYTAAPDPDELSELLAGLSEMPEVLVVFNHPLWDEMSLGATAYRELLRAFLTRYGGWFHALEFNGMRAWQENQAVLELARATGHPVVSGGDRHGAEASAVLNLSNARTMSEFAGEIRLARVSHLLLMPQYRETYRVRCAEALWDVVRDYPDHAGRVRWTDRFFYRTAAGNHAPLSAVWGGNGPGIVGTFMSLVHVLFSPRVRPTLRLAMRSRGEVLP